MDQLSVKSTISNIVNYVEVHIKENILLDNISSDAYMSKYHMHRLFSSVTHKPLMKYIRQRKLSSSVNELMNTNLKIIDIANEYSFGSEQSYIRAFKNEFGITPSKYRRSQSSIKITEQMNLYSFEEIASGVVLNPIFVIYPETKIIGLKKQLSFVEDVLENELPHKLANDFYYKDRFKIKNTVNNHIYLGVSYLDFENRNSCYYMPALEVVSFDNIPKGMVQATIPSNRYAVFRYIDFKHPRHVTFSDIRNLWLFIGQRWLKHSTFKRKHYHFEYVDASIASDDYCEIDLYVPIEDK